jgi:hypothetical protein
MPIPKRNKGEKIREFIPRCMSDEVMKSEYKDVKQRFSICRLQAKKK